MRGSCIVPWQASHDQPAFAAPKLPSNRSRWVCILCLCHCEHLRSMARSPLPGGFVCNVSNWQALGTATCRGAVLGMRPWQMPCWLPHSEHKLLLQDSADCCSGRSLNSCAAGCSALSTSCCWRAQEAS